MVRERIEYLDAIKGFLILWVVVFHLGDSLPTWITPPYRMPLFFAISGIFFRMNIFTTFIRKKINSLLVPLIVFYIISIIFCYLKYHFTSVFFPSVKFESIGGVAQYSLAFLKLFQISNEDIHEPFIVNTALWFLIVLFLIQLFFFVLNKIFNNKYILFIVCLLLNFAGLFLNSSNINGLFYICFVFDFLLYYCIGFLFGIRFIKFITEKDNILFVIIISLILLKTTIGNGYIHDYLWFKVHLLCFSCLICIIFSFLDGTKVNLFFSFLGKNSLVILTTHLLIMSIYRTLFINVVFPRFSLNSIENIYIINLSILIMTLFTCLLISSFINRYMPYLIGKYK